MTRRLTGPLAGALLAATLFTTPACARIAPPATITTPAGQAAYRADQVLDRFREISDVVKDGQQQGLIRVADAFTLIEWISGDAHATPPTTGIIQIVQTAGQTQDWKAVARQGWQTRIRALFERYPPLQPYVGVVDALLEVI